VVDFEIKRHPTPDAERDARFWLDAQPDAPRPPAALLAVLAATLVARGRSDAGVLLAAEAIADARSGGRHAVFAVLQSMAGALAALDAGSMLERITDAVVETETWWASGEER
jgi:hypothetical protein